MLILSRSIHEAIVITTETGSIIELVILDIARGQVRLGIEAPKTIEVHRKEIQLRIDREREIKNGVKLNNTRGTS